MLIYVVFFYADDVPFHCIVNDDCKYLSTMKEHCKHTHAHVNAHTFIHSLTTKSIFSLLYLDLVQHLHNVCMFVHSFIHSLKSSRRTLLCVLANAAIHATAAAATTTTRVKTYFMQLHIPAAQHSFSFEYFIYSHGRNIVELRQQQLISNAGWLTD